MVDRCTAGKEVAAFGKEHHHHAHDHADGGAVNGLAFVFETGVLEGLPMGTDDGFDCLADALAESG